MVNEKDLFERRGAAQATHEMVASLSVRLDALLASWERAIQMEQGTATPEGDKAKPQSPAEVLWTLQGQLNHLDLFIDKLRPEMESESQQANDWEQRAIMAVRDNRDDLAKQALVSVARHANAAASLKSELAELEAVRESYRNAVAAVETSLGR